MIFTKEDLITYLKADAIANERKTIKPKFFGDEIWKYITLLRKLEYYKNNKKKKMLFLPYVIYCKYRYHSLGLHLGYEVPLNVCDKGLSLLHYGSIVVASGAKVGKNCRIVADVNIGATNGSDNAAIIGDNVFIGTGAKIIGEVSIADDVAIAAGAVVTKSINEPGTTWGGIPAKKISDMNSHSNLSRKLFL